MNTRKCLFTELPATSNPSNMACVWELQLKSVSVLGGAISGRLRAGIVMGVRLYLDPALRDAVTRRLLARLDNRM